jgi:flagellar protein FliS
MNAPAKNAYAAYRKHDAECLAPAEIIHRLYQKLHGKLRVAREAILKGESASRGESLGLSLAIIGELQASLNLEQGGEIAANLNGIYDFLTRDLLLAGLHNDADKVTKALQIIEPLAEAWEQLAQGERPRLKAAEALAAAGVDQQSFHAAY